MGLFRHLVVSGGSTAGFAFFGAWRELIEQSIVNIDEIESIYATSVGTIISVLIVLGYDMKDIDDFLVYRPWHTIFKVDFHAVIRAIQEGGLFGKETIIETLKPMLLAKDISIDITLFDFHALNGKHIHFFTTRYETLDLVDVSHTTHPEWKLIDAVYASCCLPVIFDPLQIKDDYYVDGAVMKNYPLKQCLDDGCNPEMILGISHKEELQSRLASPFSDAHSTYKLFEYMTSFLIKLWTIVKNKHSTEETHVPYQIMIDYVVKPLSIMHVIESQTERRRLVDYGREIANQTISSTNFSKANVDILASKSII